MSKKRLLLAAAVVSVLAVAGLAAWLVLSIDRMVAREIERAGTETTGTSVNVAGVNVKLKKGVGTIRSFRVANPKGFGADLLLEAEAITFDIDLESLKDREPLVVEEVLISKPTLTFELTPDGKANIDAVAKHAQSAGGASEGPPTRVRIDRFVIRDAKVEADATAVAGGTKETIALRDIVLTNVGGKKGGTSDEVAAQVVAAVQKEVMRAAAQEGMKRFMSGQQEKLREKAKDKLKGLFGK